MSLQNKQMTAGELGSKAPGVINGLTFELPGSGLAVLYDGGYVNVESSTAGKVVDEYVIQSSSKTFTASKDTYVYINGADGVLTYNEQVLGAAKPSQSTIGANSEWLFKAVSDANDVTGLTDLRRWAPAGHLYNVEVVVSFVATEVGAIYIPCPTAGRIVNLKSSVIDVLAGTDVGTATLAIGMQDVYTAVTNGVITAALSSAIGVRDQATPSAANRFGASQMIRVTGAKTTAGGKLLLCITCEQTAA